MSILTIALITVVVILSIIAIPIIILALTNKAVDKRVGDKKQTVTKKNHSWIGWTIGGIVLFIVLWQFVSFWISLGLTAVVAGIVFLLTKKKKTEDGKKKEPPKNKPRLSFWIQPSTWIMFILGYIFFATTWANGFFSGSIMNAHALIHPEEGMLYVPLFGVFISVVMVLFILILERTSIGIWALGVLVLFVVVGMYNVWLMPFMYPHNVIIKWLPFLLGTVHTFPADPQISKWLILFVIVIITAFIPMLPWVKYYYNVVFARIVIFTVVVIMFGQQMLICLAN